MAVVPSLAASLFDGTGADDDIDESKIERRNAPQMLKPKQCPIWTPEAPKMLRAEIVAILDSPKASIKGCLLWLRTRDKTEITFPVTGVIRNALAPGIKGEDKDKLRAALEKEVGKTIYIKRLPDVMSAEYKKPMFMFDVWTSKA